MTRVTTLKQTRARNRPSLSLTERDAKVWRRMFSNIEGAMHNFQSFNKHRHTLFLSRLRCWQCKFNEDNQTLTKLFLLLASFAWTANLARDTAEPIMTMFWYKLLSYVCKWSECTMFVCFLFLHMTSEIRLLNFKRFVDKSWRSASLSKMGSINEKTKASTHWFH